MNLARLHDPRVLYRKRPRRKDISSLNRSRITRNSSSLRPARIAGKRRPNPRSRRESGTERRVGQLATGPSANNGVCHTITTVETEINWSGWHSSVYTDMRRVELN